MSDRVVAPLTGDGDATADLRLREMSDGSRVAPVGSGAPTASSPSQVSTSDSSSAVLLAANQDRAGVVITNEADQRLFVRFGGAASSTSYTFALMPGERLPLGAGVYTGAIQGRLESGAGSSTAMCQEFSWV